MHSKYDNIEIIINDETDKFIKKNVLIQSKIDTKMI